MSRLDKIPYTPLLHLLALLATVATVLADFVITFRNLHVNQDNWDKFHDFLPFLYLWAAGQFLSKRATAWKTEPPAADTTTITTETRIDPPAATAATRSEVVKPTSAGQPALPALVAKQLDATSPTRFDRDDDAVGHPIREG